MTIVRTCLLLAVAAYAATAVAAPLLPSIFGHDFSFDAYNQDGAFEFATNGVDPDTLVFTRNLDDHELTAYRPNWPDQPVYPVWDETTGTMFGGDLELAVEFNDQDGPINGFDVSLLGTGSNRQPGAADFKIYGTIILGPDPNDTLQGLLWALDLDEVVLYGYSDDDTYALEATGTIVGGLVPERFALIGDPGAMRGDLDVIGTPAGWIPSTYHPATDVDEEFRAAYSGETGWIPEPATLGLLLVGLALPRRRR